MFHQHHQTNIFERFDSEIKIIRSYNKAALHTIGRNKRPHFPTLYYELALLYADKWLKYLFRQTVFVVCLIGWQIAGWSLFR